MGERHQITTAWGRVPGVRVAAPRVLLVDADDDDRECMKRMLLRSDASVRVTLANGPGEALRRLETEPFDCVVVDYWLGPMTGLELLPKLRTVASPFLPVIMVTGVGDEEIAGEAMRAGVTDYLTKSQLDPGRLVASVRASIERAGLERRLHELAYYDPLTGLASRTLLLDRLQHVIDGCRREANVAALAFIDLDLFKPINDRFGHAAGDEVLVEVARRLKASVRASDTAARLGGDEFALLINEVASPEACQTLLARIAAELSAPISLGGGSLNVEVSASVGVVLIQDDATSAETVLRHADQLMYGVKRTGRHGISFFDPVVERNLAEMRGELEAVEAGLANGEFALLYQPIVNFVTRQLVGLEALLRWRHPSRGVLGPDQFWSALQHQRLGVKLGEWVIQEAVDQLAQWRAEGLSLNVSVNVSASQLLNHQFSEKLGAVLGGAALPPHALELEILEAAALDDLTTAARVMGECRALGVAIAVDDFGTGHSSLTNVRRLPLDSLKIDRSFIANVLTSEVDQATILGIVGMCRAFHKAVVAEGVECAEQMTKLIELGCVVGQGYGIARPMAAHEVPGWVALLSCTPLAASRASGGTGYSARPTGSESPRARASSSAES